ncbi:NF-kappa-B inhibitor cactus [Gryllus bimaculatus]|nr:NF-kappa-B inhibitor cactus [Gryllus bimaculatus]
MQLMKVRDTIERGPIAFAYWTTAAKLLPGTRDMDSNSSERRQLKEQFTKIEERITKVEERFTKMEKVIERLVAKNDTEVEESLQRKLSILLPKVEELLASYQRSSPTLSSLNQFPPAQPFSAVPVSAVTEFCQGNVPNVGPPAHSMQGAPASSSPSTDAPKSLLETAEKGLRRFLGDGGKVNARDERGNTALHLAASNGRTEVADLLIANGAWVDNWANQRRTPLHCAAANGHSATVARLVVAGAALEARDARGATAVALAARGGHAAALQSLLVQGASVNTKDVDGRTPLSHAVRGNFSAAVTLLAEKGADVNATAEGEDTPLIDASKHGNLEIVACLLEKGANVNTSDVNGDTPLLVAVKNQKSDFVQLLLTKGASPTKKNNKEESPLFVASRGGLEGILEYLLKAVQLSERAEIGRSLRVAASAEVVPIDTSTSESRQLEEASQK